MTIPNLIIDQLFHALRTGMSPADLEVRRFCREASDDQLREVFITDRMGHRERHLIQEEIENRKQKVILDRLRVMEDRLGELKNPHWTFTPTFWVVLAGTIAATLTLIVDIRRESVTAPHEKSDRAEQTTSPQH